jgi:hypothetical protein
VISGRSQQFHEPGAHLGDVLFDATTPARQIPGHFEGMAQQLWRILQADQIAIDAGIRTRRMEPGTAPLEGRAIATPRDSYGYRSAGR